MNSNRISLIFLAIIILVIVALSSNKIRDLLFKKSSTLSQKGISASEITPTPIENRQMVKSGNTTPETGPTSLVYLLLGAGVGLAVISKSKSFNSPFNSVRSVAFKSDSIEATSSEL